MSGGSFNYLCYKDASELLSYKEDLAVMLLLCVEEGETASPGARAIRNLLRHIRKATKKAQKLLDSDLLHDIEWWKSSDYGRDQAIAAMRGYPKPQNRADTKQESTTCPASD